ncbi:hypothetical protein SAMN04487909_11920 [Aneurinibacillus migulanus]|uniref:Uncharacterized protein n=1 Tax=Aneurinibacillus migulanus TaxID=47500 RepID=A0A1G8U6S4_ANEMI|nr:hypothetical protein SAMN04487909_11920 [Aneurinibacillus migulanus]
MHASFFSIHLWIPRVLIVQRGGDHRNGTQTRPFVSLPERLPWPDEKGQQLSPSSHLPRCFAVPPGQGKKQPSTLPCGRRTDARLGHGVVAIHSGSYWIINTLDIFSHLHFELSRSLLLPLYNPYFNIKKAGNSPLFRFRLDRHILINDR